MRQQPWSTTRRRGGFTLIEVLGALVVFSVGVLMVIQVSGVLGIQMRYSAVQSEIVVLANERLDSLEATPFDSLAAGQTTDAPVVEGFRYGRKTEISEITPVLYLIVVTMTPAGTGAPTYSATSYKSAV